MSEGEHHESMLEVMERDEHIVYWAMYRFAESYGIIQLNRVIGNALDDLDRNRRNKRGTLHSNDAAT